MGNNNQTPVQVDPKQIESAKALWDKFTTATKYTVIFSAVVLIIMALAFT